ncbi:MAG: type II toxin-antitoxin system VapC family toxin [Nitrospirae bacterium]|nr:type II toxin-antitoxin system VapC family toxin [Nitrospirota bacterium]
MGLRIPQGKTIAIDTMIFIYHFEAHPAYSPVTTKIFEQIETGRMRAVTSYITLLEILVRPFKENNRRAVSDYTDLLTTFPNLEFVPVGKEIAEMAASIRARYSVKTPDAIQIATAIVSDSSIYITNDETLKKIRDVEVIILKDIQR